MAQCESVNSCLNGMFLENLKTCVLLRKLLISLLRTVHGVED